jgi:hypothetical protein
MALHGLDVTRREAKLDRWERRLRDLEGPWAGETPFAGLEVADRRGEPWATLASFQVSARPSLAEHLGDVVNRRLAELDAGA